MYSLSKLLKLRDGAIQRG